MFKKMNLLVALCLPFCIYAQTISYNLVMTNQHNETVKGIHSRGWPGSTQCELKLAQMGLEPGERTQGTLSFDSATLCSIEWSTEVRNSGTTTLYLQQVAVGNNEVHTLCTKCIAQKDEQQLNIEQQLIPRR